MTASLRELLERGAAGTPGTVIVTGPGQHLTWRDLQVAARRVAAALARDGVKPQDRVVFVGKNDPAYFGYLFGCALAGAVPVPLNWRLSAAELTAMIEDSGTEVVFTDEAAAPAVEQAEATLPQLHTIVSLGPHDRWPSLSGWQDPEGHDPGTGAARPRALRQMVYSGAPISPTGPQQAQAALACDFVQIYGLTEATGAFAQLSAAEHAGAGHAEWLRSAGRPYPWVEVRAVSPQTGQDVPSGQIGEIWTRPAQNLAGYWHQPGQTAAALTPDGWLRTGDLGYLDDQERIYLVDRAKDMIITGGENVYPAEVEKVLAAHPALAEAAVIGVPDDRWGETVKAVVVARPGQPVDTAGVIAFCRAQLARFKCPTSVDVVDGLPRTATGKVVKPVLRERYWQGHDRRIH